MTKQCELCDLPARMFCESDQASLCWECDATVHGANFLVARHYRRLLCRSCQAPTPGRASGSRLGTTASVCNKCLGDNSAEASDSGAATRDGEGGGGEGGSRGGSMEGGGDIGDEEEDSEEDEDEEEDDEDEDENEDGDNQVVPWSSEADAEATASPPSVARCLSSDESSSGRMHVYYGLLKRRRVDDDLPSSHWQRTRAAPPRNTATSASRRQQRFIREGCWRKKKKGKKPPPAWAAPSGALTDRMRAVRHRPESAGPSTPPGPPSPQQPSDLGASRGGIRRRTTSDTYVPQHRN